MILVLGSFIVDLVASTKKFPLPGETVRGDSFNTFPGGKGANQAVQIKRLGGEVLLTGAVGKDLFGDLLLRALKKEKMNRKYIRRQGGTGVSNVTVDENGQNHIVMVPGANLHFDLNDLKKIEPLMDKSRICLTQLEMSFDIAMEFIRMAKEKGKIIILNPAPATFLNDTVLNGLDYLTPNETELALLSDMKINTIDDIKTGARKLLDKGVKNVIVTMGENGCLLVNRSIEKHYNSHSVKCIDSVGAGDAFNGGLSYALDKGSALEEAIKVASICGALSVTKKGAIPSLPTIDEINIYRNMKGETK